MARVKISECQAKKLVNQELNLPYQGWQLSASSNSQVISTLEPIKYVLKVDQGVKKRAKNGLLVVGITPEEIQSFITQKKELGYTQFILEPFYAHSNSAEKYLALERVREGVKISFSEAGGVEVEANWEQVQVGFNEFKNADSRLEKLVGDLLKIFDEYHLTYLEINPLIVTNEEIKFLDLAVEVDDAALWISPLSTTGLLPIADAVSLPSELEIKQLDANTPASLKYRIINKNGAIWMLLSGGGASLVLADEVADLGLGETLANYGEYSGSPTTDDTYLYTRVIVRDLLASEAKRKVLIIAGGVANFTDVAKTFTGIIRALNEAKDQLKEQQVKVFVRRGGPNQAKGLRLMAEFLNDAGLYGEVLGADRPLTEIVSLAVQEI